MKTEQGFQQLTFQLRRGGALFPSVSCIHRRGLTVLEERAKRGGSELRVHNPPSMGAGVTPGLCVRRGGTTLVDPVHRASTP